MPVCRGGHAHQCLGENAWFRFRRTTLAFRLRYLFNTSRRQVLFGQSERSCILRCFLGYRLGSRCRWNGEYLVADLIDFVALDLVETANGQGIHFYEHVTNVVRLLEEGYVFPLKKRYDYLKTTLECARHTLVEPGDLP